MIRKIIAVLLCLAAAPGTQAQELFVYSEPASNMPAHSVGLRLSNWLMGETGTAAINYHLIPEIMWGVNKNLMVHVEGFASNRDRGLTVEGGGLYAKYRFYSHDQLYRHFRMAAFGRISSNNGTIHQEELETNGHNTGYELGWIGTQLLHKTALSLSASYEQVTDNARHNELPAFQADRAVNMNLAAGHLFWPKDYKSYGQTNINLMVELIGQYQPQNGHAFLDVAPAIQLIFNSQTRVDIGYRQQLTGNLVRTAPNGLLIRLEHLLFHVL